jgi:hypothetical protein
MGRKSNHTNLTALTKLAGSWEATSWTPPQGISYEIWADIGDVLKSTRRRVESQNSSVLWWLADWLNFGEGTYPERYTQALDETDYSRDSLGNIARIGNSYPPDRRMDPDVVSFWTHADVERLPAEYADDLLESYASGEISSRRVLRDEEREIRKKLKIESLQDELLEAGISEWPACPLCSGSGHVAPEQREAFLGVEVEG